MDMDEYLEEMFDFKPIHPEIYSLQPLFSQGGNNNNTTTPLHPEMSYPHQATKKNHTVNNTDHHLLNNSSSSWNKSPANPPPPPPSAAPQLLSFDNSNKFSLIPTVNNNSDASGGPYNSSSLAGSSGDEMVTTKDHSSTSSPQIIRFSSTVEDDNMDELYHDASINGSQKRSLAANRTPLQAQDHLIAERKRRRKLGQLFITLSKTVPGLKKLDKASLLEDAIDYLKSLQERVNALEEEEAKRSSMDATKEDELNIRTTNGESAVPEIKARVSNKNVLIKICCKKQKGLMSKIPSEMEKMHLSVADLRVMPFGDAALDVTVLAEMHSEFRGTLKDIVDQLELVLFRPQDNN